MDIASLAIRIDSRDAKTAESDLRRMTSAGTSAERSMTGVGAGGRTAATGSRAAAVASRESATAMATQTSAAQRLTAVVRSYAAVVVGAFSAREIVQAADAWQGLENRLRLVTSGHSELQTALNDVFDIAQNTSSEMDAVAQVYQRFAQNAGTLGISLAEVAELSETVSKAVAVSGAEASAAQAALMQFGQALASGVLRGEEFNSIMEQTPALMQALARGMGVPLGSLRDLAAEGAITGDVIVEALTKARDSVDEQFNTRIKTIGQAFTELSNSATRYIGELAGATNASSTLAGAISDLASAIDDARGGMDELHREIDAFKFVAEEIGEVSDAVTDFGENLNEMLGRSGGRISWIGALFENSFADALLNTAKMLDDWHSSSAGTAAAIGAVFETTWENIGIAFTNVFNSLREQITEWVHNVAQIINQLPGLEDIQTSIYVGPGRLPYRNVIDAAQQAYSRASTENSLYDNLVQRFAVAQETRDLAQIYSDDFLNSGGGSGSGGGSSGSGGGTKKSTKENRDYIAGSLDEMLIRMGLLDEAIDGTAVKFGDATGEMGEFAVQAARNIQTALGDGLYSVLKGNFDDIGQAFGDTITRMVADAASANLAKALFGNYDTTGNIGGFLGNLIGPLFGGAASGNLTGDSLSGATWGPTYSFSDGGYTGSGGKYDPAGIVHRGEGVLSQGEIRAIGGEAGFNALRRAIRGPGHYMGGMAGSPKQVTGSAPSVAVNVVNQSSQPVQAKKGAMSFDGKRWVQEVILSDLRVNGPIARGMKGAMG